MNSLNEELRIVSDLKGWKVLGDMKQQLQGDVKVSLALREPTSMHISSQAQRFYRNCVMSTSIKLTTKKEISKGDFESFDVLQRI